jgi:phosphotransferase family enzyme
VITPDFPSEVAALLGPHPAERPGEGASRVLAGRGLVAKIGPVALIEREAEMLRTPLPVAVPELVATGPGWLVMAEVADHGGPWSDGQLHAALGDLAALHRTFEGAVPAAPLREPITAAGVADLLAGGRRAGVALPSPLDHLLGDPGPLLEILGGEPVTLLHGDPWPANVRRPAPGRRVWIDWEQASVGPAAADLASWLDQTPWHLGRDIDVDAHLDAYRCARGDLLDGTALRRAVEAASVLWFLAFDLPRLVIHAPPELAADLIAGRRAIARRLLG